MIAIRTIPAHSKFCTAIDDPAADYKCGHGCLCEDCAWRDVATACYAAELDPDCDLEERPLTVLASDLALDVEGVDLDLAANLRHQVAEAQLQWEWWCKNTGHASWSEAWGEGCGDYRFTPDYWDIQDAPVTMMVVLVNLVAAAYRRLDAAGRPREMPGNVTALLVAAKRLDRAEAILDHNMAVERRQRAIRQFGERLRRPLRPRVGAVVLPGVLSDDDAF